MKTIRVSDETYGDLLSLKRGNDSFDRIVGALVYMASHAPNYAQADAWTHAPLLGRKALENLRPAGV